MTTLASIARATALATLAIACGPGPTPTAGRTPCPSGQILTASGCLPVPDRSFPSADSGAPSNNPRPDAGLARPDATAPAGDDAAATLDPDTGTSEPDAGAPDTGADILALEGVWALQIISSDTVRSDTLNATQTITMTTLARVEMQPAAEREVGMSIQICAIEPTSFQGYSTTYPEALIASIPITQSGAALGGTELGATFTLEPYVLLLGWRTLRNPATDTVPSSSGDVRVRDTDNDNNTGATLIISGPVDGELYVAWRNILELSGTITAPDRIRGLSRSSREQNTLDASNELLAQSEITITPDPNPANSSFELSRIPGMIQPTCDAIRNSRTTLFPP